MKIKFITMTSPSVYINKVKYIIAILFVLLIVQGSVSIAIAANNSYSDLDRALHRFLETNLKGSTIGPVQAFFKQHEPKYPLKNFPLSPAEFTKFADDVKHVLRKSLIESSFEELPKAQEVIANNLYRIYLVNLASGEKLPIVTCKNQSKLEPSDPEPVAKRVPFVVFSGHTSNGILDLLVNKSGYQKAIAWRLCNAGYPVVAVGKIDSGFASRDWSEKQKLFGKDEQMIGLLLQGTKKPLASRQLSIALGAIEVAKSEFNVSKVITLGVALGGWVAVHAGIASDDVIAVMDFGGHNTLFEQYTVESFKGLKDFSQVFPGFLDIGDRNIMQLSLGGKPLLLAHGKKESEQARDGWQLIKSLTASQYQVLGAESCLMVLEHEGGHEFTNEAVSYIDGFYKRFVGNDLCFNGAGVGK